MSILAQQVPPQRRDQPSAFQAFYSTLLQTLGFASLVAIASRPREARLADEALRLAEETP